MQPTLTRYRVPVFRDLAQRPGIELTVCHGELPGIPTCEPDGFAAIKKRYRSLPLPGGGLEWHVPPAELIDPKRTDVAVLQWSARFLSLPWVLARLKLAGIPTVLWGHGYSKGDSAWKRRLRVNLGLLGDALVVYNFGTADDLVTLGVPRSHTFVAQNTLDAAPIAMAAAKARADAGALATLRGTVWSPEGPNLLYVSRFVPGNRTDRLITAVAELRRSLPGVRAVLIGSGSEERRLRAMVAEHKLTDRVTFAGEIYDEEALAKYFVTADMFVYPENIGLSLNHAMMYGLPVITSDRTDAQNPEIEALRHEFNGLLYRHGSDDALQQTIKRLHEDRELREYLARNAEQTMRSNYSISRMVDGLEAAIRAVSRKRSSAGAGADQDGGSGGQPAGPGGPERPPAREGDSRAERQFDMASGGMLRVAGA